MYVHNEEGSWFYLSQLAQLKRGENPYPLQFDLMTNFEQNASLQKDQDLSEQECFDREDLINQGKNGIDHYYQLDGIDLYNQLYSTGQLPLISMHGRFIYNPHIHNWPEFPQERLK